MMTLQVENKRHVWKYSDREGVVQQGDIVL